MRTRTLVWMLAVFAAVLIVGPFIWMLAMTGGSFGGGMMGSGMMSGGMAGMHFGGFLWFILTIVVVAALVALVVRGETKA